jgi:hypothetical protein
MSRSRLDPNQISQCEHDEESGAKKVKLLDAQMELSADDGDSVQTQGRVFEYSPASDEAFDITACREIKVYSSGSMTIEISPDADGDNFIALGGYTDESPILSVLARRARVTSGSAIKVLGRG